MLKGWEVAELVRQKAGIRLRTTPYTASLLIDENPTRPYFCALYGPYTDPTNRDVRIFVKYRTLAGHVTMDLLVQDRYDDAFLNYDACGAKKYQQVLIQW